MPKKDKDKKQAAGAAKKKVSNGDPLPQVWLPDQEVRPVQHAIVWGVGLGFA